MRVLPSAASKRADASLTLPSALQLVPLSVEIHHAPWLVSAPVTAMPSSATESASVTLSSWPAGTAKSTRLDTSVPTAPTGAPASSLIVTNVGLLPASSTGALLVAVMQALNSDVSWVVRSVAVALMLSPAATVAASATLNVACPAPSVVTSTKPR